LKTFAVIISDAAAADLRAIYDHIAQRSGPEIAFRFVDDIESYCLGFDLAPERGTKREDLRAGLRTVGFRRRATILFEVNNRARQVIVHGVYYAGRSYEGTSEED
jgi:plasmid stabilization system protein ParE